MSKPYLQIEKNIAADIKTLLDAAGIANVVDHVGTEPESATYVRVAVLNMRSNLAGGNIPYGNRQADIAIECFSYYDDDKTGATLAALVEDVRDIVCDASFVSNLNTASSYIYYFGVLAGDDIPDEQERYRIKSIQFSLITRQKES